MRYMLIISILMASAACMAVDYAIPFSTETVAVDGSIDQQEWQDALHIPIYYPNDVYIFFNEPNDNADLSGDVYIKWDENYLYVAARVYDDNLQWLQGAPGPFNSQDAFQICLNPGLNPSATIFENAPIYDIVPQDNAENGPQLYKHSGSYMSLPNALVNGQIYSDGYSVEVAMPWNELAIEPLPGQNHGIGFILVDFDEGTSADTLMADFSGTVTNINNWNATVLISEEGCGLEGIHPADLNHDCVVDLKDLAIFAGQWLVCTDPDLEDCIDAR
jgi:hypothetical protein